MLGEAEIIERIKDNLYLAEYRGVRCTVMGGYSIFASSLDSSDRGVRLEQYMAAERGGKDGWKVDYCCLVE